MCGWIRFIHQFANLIGNIGMLTFFTSCKPFRGEDAIAQRNAILSWKQLRPEPQIIILGNDPGASEFAAEVGVQHVPEINRSEFGNPLVDDLFARAQEHSRFDICCYINADIILFDDFMQGVEIVAARNEDFLLVGKRHDLDVNGIIDFESAWERDLRQKVNAAGQLYHLPGMDYFVFRKNQWKTIPAFVLGNLRWDNWMIFEARRLGLLTVDGTNAITVVHQNHAMKHAEESENGTIDHDPAAVYNLGLYGKGKTAFFHLDATHVLTSGRIKRAFSFPYMQRRLVTTPVFHPRTAAVCNFLRKITG